VAEPIRAAAPRGKRRASEAKAEPTRQRKPRHGDDDETDGFRGRNGKPFPERRGVYKNVLRRCHDNGAVVHGVPRGDGARAAARLPAIPARRRGFDAERLEHDRYARAARVVRRDENSQAPSGSRVVARRGARGALEIVIPPLGVSRSDAVAELGFAATWSAFTGAWTVGAFRGPTPAVALFSLPFWGVSAHLGKAALAAATETTRVVFFPPSDSEIEQSAGDVPCPSVVKKSLDGTFRVSWEAFGRQVGHAGGSLLDLDGGEIVTRAYVNGVPQTGVELREGVKSHAVGRGLHPAEQTFVAELLAAALADARDARATATRGDGSKVEDERNFSKTPSYRPRVHLLGSSTRAGRGTDAGEVVTRTRTLLAKYLR
jgi:hypothetical protein